MSSVNIDHRSANFADQLVRRMEELGSSACVGLDPVVEKLPACVGADQEWVAIERFCVGVIDAVASVVPAVKFQSACFERWGSEGVAAMGRLIGHARRAGVVVILDAKRGDIGVSAEHYAAAAVAMGADAMTVNGYLGPATLGPYVEAGLGLFVLVRTSNPDSDAVQSAKLADGRSVAEMMADHVARLGEKVVGQRGFSGVGAVVGATKAEDGVALRRRMPKQIFLVPGYGAQGGTAQDILRLRTEDGGGVLVTASRSVIYAFDVRDAGWGASVRRAAEKFVGELRAIH